MSLRSLAFGLIVTCASLVLVACQVASIQPLARATNAPAGTPTISPTPRSISAPIDIQDESSAKNDAPTSANIAHRTPTPQPATSVEAEKQHLSASLPTDSRVQAEDQAFYSQDGVTLEYYWPIDDGRNLSADETEILAYNESDETIEFVSPKIAFTENGRLRAQFSGTWEKFPSRDSWDRIEYISFLPSPYGGEKLLVYPGEKAKIHWHLEQIA